MAADLRTLLERHVEIFNEAVRSGDYGPLIATYAEGAVLRFDGVERGPFQGREEIARAYSTWPPDDTIALIDMEELGPDGVKATFEWDAGGTGEMVLRWNAGWLVEVEVSPSVLS